jgi:hypothetical protein
MMEVEPDQFEGFIADLAMDFFEVFTKSFLGAFFINEIDKCAIFVVFFNVLVVFFGDFEIKLIVGMDADFGTPFEVWILVPEEGHRATELNMREYVLFATIFSQENKLSFSSIRSVSIKISPSGNPPFTLSSFISSRDKCDFTGIINASMSKVNDNKSRDKPSNPLIGLNLNKVINPVTVIHVTQAFIFHWAVGGDELLERVGEIVLVAEVKIFGGEHLLQAVDVNTVGGGLGVGQGEKVDFLDLEYFPVVNLADHWSLCDHDQVIVDLHLDYAVDCFDGYFLWLLSLYFDEVVGSDFGDLFARLVWKQSDESLKNYSSRV